MQEKNFEMNDVTIGHEQELTNYVIQTLYFIRHQSLPRIMNLLGHAGGGVFRRHPSNLASLSERTGLDLPEASELMLKHTRFPLYIPFLDENERKGLYEHHMGDGLKLALSLRSYSQARFGICTECVREDYKFRIFPASRRLFAMPGIVACPTHKRPLLTFCKDCQEKGYTSSRPEYMVPGLKCPCEKDLVQILEMDERGLAASVEIASISQQILQGLDTSMLSPEKLHQALRMSVQYSANLRGPSGYEQLTHSFQQALGTEVYNYLRFSSFTFQRFLGQRQEFVMCPIQSIAAIFSVFGTYENYIKALETGKPILRFPLDFVSLTKGIHYRAAMKEYPPNNNEIFIKKIEALSKEELEELRGKSRAWFMGVKKRYPDITRSHSVFRHGKNTYQRFLMSFDKAWLAQHLPYKEGYANSTLITSKDISDFKDRIPELSQSMREKNPLKRVVMSNLSGQVKAGRFYRAVYKDEELLRLVNEHIDTDEGWRERVTAYMCEFAQKYAPSLRWARRSTFDELTYSEFKAKYLDAKKWFDEKQKKLSGVLPSKKSVRLDDESSKESTQ